MHNDNGNKEKRKPKFSQFKDAGAGAVPSMKTIFGI
jgi:hypothetical protein